MNKELLDRVLEQIAKDVESGDMTAIEELIADIPNDKALHFLPEEENQEIDLDGGLSAINE
jgi:phage gp29-like protein